MGGEKSMDFRKVFDTIPDQFDKYRPRYSAELFTDLIGFAEIRPGKTVLELGLETGQATEPTCIPDAITTQLSLASIWLQR